jgi:hypothetical protein
MMGCDDNPCAADLTRQPRRFDRFSGSMVQAMPAGQNIF